MNNQYRPQRFSFLPLVVKNLLIINGLVFLGTYVFFNTMGIDLSTYLGLHYPKSEDFAIYQFITHLFMHGSPMHLFSNMFALWMFGTAIENYWGPKRFLIYYMITGLGAALLHLLVNYYEISQIQKQIELLTFHIKDPGLDPLILEKAKQTLYYHINGVTVGASGAVFGVLLAFGMLFPNSWIYVFFALPIKAKYFVILYGLFELYSGLQNNPSDNVAHFAHLGGMLFGFILIKYWNRNRFRKY